MQAQDKTKPEPGDGANGGNRVGGQSITILVNTRAVTVEKRELSYDEVVALAFPQAPTGANVLITVTYRRGHGDKPDGSLLAGQTVKAKEGMKFIVSATDKS
jgi:hypothetical protein